MKAVINGRRYDTDTALKIGTCSYGNASVDLHYCDETLYKTPAKGLYFLAGEGGPLSVYGRSDGPNSRTSGERIVPMTQKQALLWAESHLPADAVEEHFGDQIEDA
jgi:hypothetical protein